MSNGDVIGELISLQWIYDLKLENGCLPKILKRQTWSWWIMLLMKLDVAIEIIENK